MTSALQIFEYKGATVRTVLIDGEPWMVAKDVCEILGLTNPTEALKSLDDDERMTLSNTEGILDSVEELRFSILSTKQDCTS